MDLESTAAFFERYADRAAEVAWSAALAWVETAVDEAREGKWGRWRAFPQGELRWFRGELAGALGLARFAVALRQDENDHLREITGPLERAAAEAGRSARREGTREAERVRLLRAAARREGRKPTDQELHPWLFE